jgi:hypothetical protein
MADKPGELDVLEEDLAVGNFMSWSGEPLKRELDRRLFLQCDGLVRSNPLAQQLLQKSFRLVNLSALISPTRSGSQPSYRGDRIITGVVPALHFEEDQEGPNSFVPFNSR